MRNKFFIPLSPINIKNKDLYGFDVETIPKRDNKFLMGSIVGEGLKYGYISWNKNNFRKVILSEKFKNKTIFATNLMFDFMTCFSVDELLDRDKFKYLLHSKSSNFIFIKFIPNNITFLDTFNFYPVSVKKLGETINLYKYDFPKIINKIKSKKELTNEDIKKIENII